MAPPLHRRLAWGLALGGLFFLVYGPVNYLTASLSGVPSLHLPWEWMIPFVPEMILPYLSIDLLFVVSFLMARSDRELRRHALRVATAILLSGALFLLFPLRFGFERPPVEGWTAPLVALLGLDLPFNQCPSLHVSLALILWPPIRNGVRRMADGPGHRLLAGWFLLIGASPLLVYQHHLIDILGGLLAGALILYAVPLEEGPRLPVNGDTRRRAALYLLPAVLLTALAALLGGWALTLLAPALSLALVGAAYATGRADYLSKRDGRHCAVIRALFAPYLLLQRLTWHHYRRRGPAWAEVAPGLYLGRRLTAGEARALRRRGVRSVLDLSPELAESGGWAGADYHHVPWPDLVPPGPSQLSPALRFIERRLPHGGVYIHCTLGFSRSAAVALAWLAGRGLPLDEALARLRALRRVVLPESWQQALKEYANG